MMKYNINLIRACFTLSGSVEGTNVRNMRRKEEGENLREMKMKKVMQGMKEMKEINQ